MAVINNNKRLGELTISQRNTISEVNNSNTEASPMAKALLEYLNKNYTLLTVAIEGTQRMQATHNNQLSYVITKVYQIKKWLHNCLLKNYKKIKQ